MADAFAKARDSKGLRVLFACALALGLWPAASLATAAPAYASDGDEPTVDVEGYVKAQADSSKVGEERATARPPPQPPRTKNSTRMQREAWDVEIYSGYPALTGHSGHHKRVKTKRLGKV